MGDLRDGYANISEHEPGTPWSEEGGPPTVKTDVCDPPESSAQADAASRWALGGPVSRVRRASGRGIAARYRRTHHGSIRGRVGIAKSLGACCLNGYTQPC
jgi:hypothetical protein